MASWNRPAIWLTLLLSIHASAMAAPPSADDSPFFQPALSRADAPAPQSVASGADPNKVQQATYRVAAESEFVKDSAVKPPAAPSKRPEPMPISGFGNDDTGTDASGPHGAKREGAATSGAWPAMLTMIASLAVVLGLFFSIVWLMRRGMPQDARLVPGDVLKVLGRSALAGRQQMHVVRFGNKLLLVSVTPGGAETLSEITDPVEVDRLAGICQQSDAHSATNAFRQILRQFSPGRTRASAGLETDDA